MTAMTDDLAAPDLLVELVDHTLLLTLNRPAKRNAISREMVDLWSAALARARTDDAVRNVVVTGSGTAFCAGGDLRAMGADRGADGADDYAEIERFPHRVAVATEDLDKPVIAAINGPAVGAGLGMALTADLRFMSDRARVSEGYINVGLFPGDGDIYHLPRVVGIPQALMMFWSGDFLDARQCLSMGLANRVIPHDRLLDETLAFADRLSSASQVAVRAIKRATYAGARMNLRDTLGMTGGYCAIVNRSPERVAAFEQFMAARAEQRKGTA